MYQPIPIKRSTKYGNNYWEAYSPKIKRNVRLFSDLEYDNWILLESNPQVIAFCEQPLRIRHFLNGEWGESIMDMWVQYAKEKECFIEVKYKAELEHSNSKYERSIKQISLQRDWCINNGYKHQVITDGDIRKNRIHLDNCKLLVANARNAQYFKEIDLLRIVKFIGLQRLNIDQIHKEYAAIPIGKIREAVFYLIYKGTLKSDIDLNPITNKTEVWLNNEQ